MASFIVLVVYNQYYFGHLLGLPQPSPAFHSREIENIFALVFDRHQGFLIQVPTTALGLIGLWVSRRANLFANLSVVVSVALIIVINGTQPEVNFMGGTALAGRFEWTVVPILLAWSAFLIKELERSRRTVTVLTVVIAVLWAVEGGLVAWGHHVLVNSLIVPFAPYDPALYPGWWGWLNQYLPSFLMSGWWGGVLAELLFFGGVAVLLLAIARRARTDDDGGTAPARHPLRYAAGVGVGLMVVALVVALVRPSPTLPNGALTVSETVLGGPWTTQAAVTAYPPAQVEELGAGTYTIAVQYQLTSQSRSSALAVLLHPPEPLIVTGWFSAPHFADASAITVATALFARPEQHLARVVPLAPTTPAGEPASPSTPVHVVSSSFESSTTETLSIQVTLAAQSNLHIVQVLVRKIS